MPTFPTYLRDQTPTPPGVPSVDINAGAIERGMKGLAAGIGEAGDAMQQYQQRLDKQSMFDDNVKLDRYRVQTENDLKEWQQKGIPENATGAAQQFLATRQKANQEFLKTISPQNQGHFGQILTVDQEKVLGAAHQTEEVARNKYEVGILQTGLDKWMTTLRTDPSQKDEAMKDLGVMIDHTTALSPTQRAEAKKNIDANLSAAKWQAVYANDPVEGMRRLGIEMPRSKTGPAGITGSPETTPAAPGVPVFTAGDKPKGMVQTGNIDLTRRPQVKNPDGSISTVDSFSYERDGKEVLIPSVSDEGKHWDVESKDPAVRRAAVKEAKTYWEAKSQNLGVFNSPGEATAYAEKLHKQQEDYYLKGGKDQTGSVTPAGSAPKTPVAAKASAITASAQRLGVSPEDLATVIMYESGGDVNRRGGKGGNYFGLIQFGPAERQKYGIKPNMTFEAQVNAAEQFLKDRGFKPGMGIMDLYSTINAGSPGHYDASDGNGTVRSHVQMMDKNGSRKKAVEMLGGTYDPATSGASDDAFYRPIVGGDPEYASIPYDMRVKLSDQAMRDYTTMQTQQAADLKLQQSTLQNSLQNMLIDGKAGLPDIEKARQDGWLGDADQVEKFRGIVEKRDKDQADGRMFMQGLGTPGTQFNPFDATQQKGADEAFKAMGGSLKALDTIYGTSGIVPKSAATMMKSGIFGTDQAAGTQTLQVASNILAKNPNAFRAVDGGTDIANAAAAYQHFLELGKTTADATRLVLQQNDPSYKAKVKVSDTDLKAFTESITAPTITKAFDEHPWIPFYGNPTVGTSPEQQTSIIADFREVASDFYKQSGDASLAMAQAKAQLEKVYGVTRVFGGQAVVKYPVEKTYPPIKGDTENGYGYVIRQATEDVKAIAGHDVAPGDITFLPIPVQTEAAFAAGKPVPYMLSYRTTVNGQPTQEVIYGKAFTADLGRAQQEATTLREPIARDAEQRDIELRQRVQDYPKAIQDSLAQPEGMSVYTPPGKEVRPPPPTQTTPAQDLSKQMQDIRKAGPGDMPADLGGAGWQGF